MFKKILMLSCISLLVLSLSGCGLSGNIDLDGEIEANISNVVAISNTLQTESYEPVYRFLDLYGNHSQSNNVIGNYVTPTKYFIKPQVNETFILSRLLISIEDFGTFDSGSYGNGITLNNGITIFFILNGTQYNLTNDNPIITNANWGTFAYDIDNVVFGSGNQFLNVRLTFEKGGQPIILHSIHNDSFGIIVQDDFTNLINHKFLVQGFNAGLQG